MTEKPLSDSVIAAIVAFASIAEDFPDLLPSDRRELAVEIDTRLSPRLGADSQAVVEAVVRELRAALATPAPAQPERCPHCDDTGDVHSIDGEWRGRCTCEAGAAAPVEGAAWQDIETAPKDESVLLTDGQSVGEGFWHDGTQCYGHRGEAGWFWESDRGDLLIASNAQATHWMPLPAAPKEKP